MPLLDAARLPEGLRIYAIGDVHGCLDLLVQQHERVAADLEARPAEDWRLIHLGDYVDRGPESMGVLDHLIGMRAEDERVVCLLGNHDAMFADFMAGRDTDPSIWLANGGIETVESYGMDRKMRMAIRNGDDSFRTLLLEHVPAAHREFLERLAIISKYGDFVFVHAGINPSEPLEAQRLDDLIWIREPFLSWTGDLGVVVVHGHTITRGGPVVRRQPDRDRHRSLRFESADLPGA